MAVAAAALGAVQSLAATDEAVVERALKAAKAAIVAIPSRHLLTRDPEAFGRQEILEPMKELSAALDAVRLALREKDAPAELRALRERLRARMQAFLDEFEDYRAVYRSTLTSARTLAELRKSQPPKGQTPSEQARYNAWLARYNAAVAENDRQSKGMDGKHPQTVEACQRLVAELEQARETLKEIRAKDAAGRPSKPEQGTAPADPFSGSVSELVSRSACGPDEFHAAVRENRADVLSALAGRLVFWQGMLLEPPATSPERAAVKVMAGRGAVLVEFPPGSPVASVKPGASIVVAGELRRSGELWLLRAAAWGLLADLNAGRPMTRCEWPPAEGATGAPGKDR